MILMLHPVWLPRCGQCGSAGYCDDIYCARCGATLPRHCYQCGAPIKHPVAYHCTQCGSGLPAELERPDDREPGMAQHG
jgi:hypothetical protein